MEPVVAVIAVSVIAALAIVMLGWVQAYRTRKATREALDRTITPISDEHALGLVTHQATEDRIREATTGDEPG
ncbi:MAG: hypothetical protein U0Q07_14740 [Acidimicrobiales bacterium]